MTEITPSHKFKVLGIKKISGLGDKERSNFEKMLKARDFGKYIGYNFRPMRKNSELTIIGEHGSIECDIKYTKKTYEIVPILDTKVHYRDGGKIDCLCNHENLETA